MAIQVLEEYRNRIEYKVLNNYCNYDVVKINELKMGSLIIPGVILSKMPKESINILNTWIQNKGNQLVLLPSWNEENLKKYFNTSFDIRIKKDQGLYKDIPVDYKIESTVKDKTLTQNGKIYGINYRNNLSSGLMTVVTLPLLDYKLIEFQDKFTEIFLNILQKNVILEEAKEFMEEFEIDELHVLLIILCASQINTNISDNLEKYFGKKYDLKVVNQKYKELINFKYINSGKLTEKGIILVKNRKLKSFIDVVKERSEKEDGWC